MEDKLITITEAANILGVSKITLRRWDNSGKFKAMRTLGNVRRYSLNDINNLLKSMGKNETNND